MDAVNASAIHALRAALRTNMGLLRELAETECNIDSA
jgi:hypothetical protein